MHRTAILRFSDAESPTLPSHNQIIKQHGATWWGWWKKRAERFDPDFLRYLSDRAAREGVWLGLLNRKGEETYASAYCQEVRTSEGAAIPSPDASLTPEYYRDASFPAWFKFTEIRTLKRNEFVREFREIPSLDPTLYDITIHEDGKFEMHPGYHWSMEPIDAPGDSILHISDLHFGADHGFPLEDRPGFGVDAQPLSERLTRHIVQTLGVRVGIVVVSGDLITRGDGNAYPLVRRFLEELLNGLELENKHCVIVPGNHDLWTLDVEHPTRTYGHEQPYKDFLGNFFGTGTPQGLERPRRYRLQSGEDLIFIELNSARIRSDALKEYGYVAAHRYEKLLKWVEGVLVDYPPPRGSPTMFAVLHHHILPVWGVTIPDETRPVSLCLDAGELIDQFQKFGISVVLHGHQHFPFIGSVSRAPTGIDVNWDCDRDGVYVLGCGSSGASANRLPREMERGVFGNIFGLYTMERNALDVRFEQYSNREAPRTLWRMKLPVKNLRATVETGIRAADISSQDAP